MSAAEGTAKGVVLGLYQVISDFFHNGKRKKRLRAMLSDPRYSFGRSVNILAEGIACDVATTKQLLVAIGARPSETDASLWTMKPSPPPHN